MTTSSTQVVTPKGQFSYPCLFNPRANNLSKDGKKYYSIDILFDKTTDLKKVQEAIDAAMQKKFGADKAKYPKNLKSPIKDGDLREDPAYADKFYITCRNEASRGKVEVYDRKRKALESESELVGGDFGHLCINFYAYDYNGNRGVSASLQGVMLVEKTSEPFSKNVRAFEVFESLADDEYDNQNAEHFN